MAMIISLLVLTGLDCRLSIWKTPAAIYSLFLLTGGVAAAGACWSLFYTRTIVGPIRRIRMILDAIAEGRLEENVPVRFRKGDRFQEVGRGLDGCIASARRSQEDIRRMREGVDAAWRALKEKNDPAEALRALDRLRSSPVDPA